MDPRFRELPTALRERARIMRLPGEIPALIAHPDPAWLDDPGAVEPAPVMLWFHGRTADKELDPGRYLRWIRSGIAACSIDLPGHGERAQPGFDQSDHTLLVAKQASEEIDSIVEALGTMDGLAPAFDTRRMGIGGMSAGGMVTLIRLTHEHPFVCTAVESTAGDFRALAGTPFEVEPMFSELNPAANLDSFRPMPFLALHTEADQTIPFRSMTQFLESLREHYIDRGEDPEMIELVSWPMTGAPSEHAGFGKFSNDAKNTQTEFLKAHLLNR